MLSMIDQDLRGLLTREIAESGRAPTPADLARLAHLSVTEVDAGLKRLHENHALLLHPHVCKPWVVHPFALAPGSCWVQSPKQGYWANCLYCGFGFAAALKCEAVISTRLAGEAEPVVYKIVDGQPTVTSDVFHLSTPAAKWWDNVIFACSTFQPFRSEAEIDAWCNRHDLPRGHVFTIPELWAFAVDWYGRYLEVPWRKRTREQTLALFERHKLTSTFWSI